MSVRPFHLLKSTVLALALTTVGLAPVPALAHSWSGGYHHAYHRGYYGHSHFGTWLGVALVSGLAANVIYDSVNRAPPVVYSYNPPVSSYGVPAYGYGQVYAYPPSPPPVAPLPPGTYYRQGYAYAYPTTQIPAQLPAPDYSSSSHPPLVYHWDSRLGQYVLVPR